MSGTNIAEPTDVCRLYHTHHSWLRTWLKRRLDCSETAADLAQDTFTRVLLRDREGAVIREPRAYLSHIARALVINHWRRRDLEQAYLQALASMPEPEVPSPEHRQQLLDALCEIDAALDELPQPVRQAFLMSQLEGLKYREIAERLAVSEITIKRYVKRALVCCLMSVESD